MKVAFCIDQFAMTGGVIVVLEHAAGMARRGHGVWIVTESPVPPGDLAWFRGADALGWTTYDGARGLAFDFAVSTWWSSCYNLHRIEAGKYVYFNQSVESRFYPPDRRAERCFADSTYLLGLDVVTEATWIRDYLAARYGLRVEVALNGIRKDLFTMEGERHAPREEGRLRVLVEGPLEIPYKNVKRALEVCRASKADEVWLMTPSRVDAYPGVDRVFSRVPYAETHRVYRSCDVLVKLSLIEGMFGPPLEMFHCGGTAVVYDVSGHEEYIAEGKNALVVPMGDEGKALACVNRLKEDRALLESLKRGAARTAARWRGWDEASRVFEGALVRLGRNPGPGRHHLRNRTELIRGWNDLAGRTFRGLLRAAGERLAGAYEALFPEGSVRRRAFRRIRKMAGL